MSDYTLLNLDDTDDDAAKNGMGHVLEGHFPRKALGCETIAMSLQRLKPDQKLPFGHTHKVDEEIYVVLSGSGSVLVGGETRELKPMDAARRARHAALVRLGSRGHGDARLRDPPRGRRRRGAIALGRRG